MSQQILLLGAPALLGGIAEMFSIRVTFAVMIPPLILAFYLARYLAPGSGTTVTRRSVPRAEPSAPPGS